MAVKKKSKINKMHDIPGLYLTRPLVKAFTVDDNNGNWLIQRPLFRWVRADKLHAQEDADMMNIGYHTALLDILAKRPEAMKMLAKMKEYKEGIEKQVKGVDF